MSCRETSGNSATTSLVKFLTGAPEKIVSHEFHNLRREGRNSVHSEDADIPAPQDEVKAFLESHRNIALEDSRIKESRRVSLHERFNQALVDLENGRGPNRATFYAWRELEQAVETAKSDSSDPEKMDESEIGVTPEGLEISYGDVLAARRMAEEAHQKLTSKRQIERERPVVNQVRYQRKKESVYVADLQDKADRLQMAYDSTDVGYAKLQAALSDDVENSVLKERLTRATNLRNQSSGLISARSQASRQTLDEITVAKDEAEAKVRHYESLVRAGKQNNSNSVKLQESLGEFKQLQRAFYYKIAMENKLEGKASSSALNTPSEWATVAANSSAVKRADAWRSMELLSADLDRARIRIGRISKTEAERRALRRAQARQALLDSENNNEFDPANKRYAEMERNKRVHSQKLVS